MSGHRVELGVTFWVDDDNVRRDVEAVVSGLEELLTYGLVTDHGSRFTVSVVGVDGNGYYEKYGTPKGSQ